jgi:hypothetical protein
MQGVDILKLNIKTNNIVICLERRLGWIMSKPAGTASVCPKEGRFKLRRRRDPMFPKTYPIHNVGKY